MITLGDRRQSLRGMTILELAVVMVIIGILASMLLPIYSRVQARASEGNCIANLKSLYIGASGYLQANGSWPQISNTLIASNPAEYAKKWVAVLKPFGIPHQSWICPEVQRGLHQPISTIDEDQNYRVDYLGMAFSEEPSSPYPENPFPWFVEKGGMHGRGNLLILSNGNTTSITDMVR